jgi:hypothetical protein
LSRLVSHLSELSGVIILTKFWGIVDNCRKPVDNPAALRASFGKWGGSRLMQRPKIFIQASLLVQILVEEIHDL